MLTLTPITLHGTSPLLSLFAHLSLAPMFARPRVIVTAYEGGVSVRVELPIYDRYDGAEWTVATSQNMAAEGFSGRDGDPRRVAEDMVGRCLEQALVHEARECLRGDGGAVVREEHPCVVPSPMEAA